MIKHNCLKGAVSILLVLTMLVTTNIFVFAEELSSSTRSIDEMLLKSQEWLNSTYSSNSAFGSVPEDGISRRATVNGCIRALQIELGITATADNFGPGTESRFKAQYPNGIIQQNYPSTEESNVYGIIQCALWTKGYSTGASSITKHFYDGTGGAIIELKKDMGFNSPNSTVTLNVMKSLLSMDYYVTVSGGSEKIRKIQQELNRTYPTYLGIIPCDGLYTRNMNKALIIVLQAIEGYSEDDATGYFGSGTKANLPVDFNNSSSWIEQYEKYKKCIKLIQYALCCNGYEGSIDLSNDQWNSSLSNVVKQFQKDLNIEQTGTMNVDTWMALLLSKGNPDRYCFACDTKFEMTQERLNYLNLNGYGVVGRYLTGESKGLKDDEPQRILDNGLSFFPIFQETLFTDTISKYNYDLGASDAIKAMNRALELGIPKNTIIYFAIDFDPNNTEISSYVIPYFKGINDTIGYYKVGVYGTRNVCSQVMDLGYSETCFVSDMSTGYSGNMGFKMPNNWNLDQFHEYTVTTASGEWNIDKVSYSDKFPVVTSLDTYHKVIPANVTNYYFGEVSFSGENTGSWFTACGNKIKYRIVWECTDGADPYHYLNTYLYNYDGKIADQVVYKYGEFEYVSDWIDITDGSDYRFQYSAYNGVYNLPLNVKASIYIDTKRE